MNLPSAALNRRMLMRTGLTLGAALVASACTSQTAFLPAAPGDSDVEVIRHGTGTPAIVLIHGLGDDMRTWKAVLAPLSRLSLVVAYNRPGYGRSAWHDGARDAVAVSDEIGAVLGRLGLTGPVVLVGHSLGGIYAQVFARRFPDRVAGLVLVDTTVPGQTRLIRQMMPTQFALLPALMLQEPVAVRREFRDAEAAENQVLAYPPYRAGPVVVLAASRADPLSSAAYLEARREAMRALAQSYGATFRLVNCGHFIQREEPQAVVEAVRSIFG